MLALGGLLCLGTTVGCAAAVLTFSEVMMQVRQGTDHPGAETPHNPARPMVLMLLLGSCVFGTEAWGKLHVLEGGATCMLLPSSSQTLPVVPAPTGKQ